MGLEMPHARPKHTIVVEHLDPELEAWQMLEYQCIARECDQSNTHFLLSGLESAPEVGKQLQLPAKVLSEQSVEALYSSPEQRQRVCLLDPRADSDLSPEDGDKFDAFLFGGILGDDPPRDRTGELRKMGFSGRRLGAEQMTTDTAARVTRMVVQDGKLLDEIDYVNRPEIEIPKTVGADKSANPQETVSMPFRYVKGANGKPVMPNGMLELLASDADKDILDLL